MKPTLRLNILLLFLLLTRTIFSQETTATFSGLVTDAKKQPVAGASIMIKHEPTGYQTGTQTNNKGIFVIPNLRPGGPYTVTVSYLGEEKKQENVNLVLGNNPDFNVDLKGS